MVEYNDNQYDECFLKFYFVSYLFMMVNLVTTFFLYFGCNTEINKLRQQVGYLLKHHVDNNEYVTEEEETETETEEETEEETEVETEVETEEEIETESESEHESETAYTYLNTRDLRVIGEGIKKMVRRCYSDTATYLKPTSSKQQTATRVIETSDYKFKNY